MPTAEQLKRLRTIEQASGIVARSGGLGAGNYHVVITGGEVRESEAGHPRLQITHEVVCGERKGAKQVEFHGWFSDDTDKTPKVRGATYGRLIKGMSELPENTVEAYEALVDAGDDYDAVTEAFAVLAKTLTGHETYLRRAESKRADKAGELVTYYVKPFDCECKTSAVSV